MANGDNTIATLCMKDRLLEPFDDRRCTTSGHAGIHKAQPLEMVLEAIQDGNVEAAENSYVPLN